MKKITLILSIMLIWGCSQAHEQEAGVEAKETVAEQAEAVKDVAIEQANELTNGQVEAVAEDYLLWYVPWRRRF